MERVSEETGIKLNTLKSAMGKSRNSLSKRNCKIISNIYGIDYNWLVTGVRTDGTGLEQKNAKKMRIDPRMYAYVPKAKAILSAGGGIVPEDAFEEHRYAFLKVWINQVATSQANCILMPVDGDSMLPLLESGDTVLIDKGRNVLVGDGIYAFGEGDLIHIKKLQRHGPIIRMLEPDEERRLLAAAEQFALFRHPWIYHYVLIAMRTGLRKQNILRMRWDEVDLRKRMFTVRQKGDRRHVVPMASDVHELMDETLPQSAWCFPNTKTELPYGDFAKTWTALKMKAAIDPDFRFHDLRHHVASMLIKHTGNPVIAQSILGHSDIRVTQRYMHLFATELAQAVEKLVIQK